MSIPPDASSADSRLPPDPDPSLPSGAPGTSATDLGPAPVDPSPAHPPITKPRPRDEGGRQTSHPPITKPPPQTALRSPGPSAPAMPVAAASDAHPVVAQWAPPEPPRSYVGVAGWALAFAIVALASSMFVAWGLPVGLIAITIAIVALRRRVGSRTVAVWALTLGAVSVLYSTGWLLWAATR